MHYQKSVLAIAVISSVLGQSLYAAEVTKSPQENEVKTLDTIVVTASGQEVDLKNAPASISVITAKEIEKRPVSTLADVLKHVPGVTGGLSRNGDGSKIKLRGLPENYTLILIDGKRIGSSRDTNYRPDLGRQDLNWITPEMIERIEVVRGPMSSLYGSDAMGGVINIITKKIPEHWGGNLTYNYTQPTTSGDRGRTFQAGAMLGGALTDHIGLRLNASQIRRESDKNFTNYAAPRGGDADLNQSNGTTGYITNNFGSLVNLKINDQHDLALEAKYGVEKNLKSEGVNTIDAASGKVTSENATKSWGASKLESYGYNATWNAAWTDNITSKLSAYYNDYDQSGDGLTATSNESIVEGQVHLPFNFIVPHQLVVGGQWKQQELQNTDTIGVVLTDAKGQPIKDKNNKNVASYDGKSYAGQSKLKTDSWALFLEDTLSLTDQLKFTLGNRFDHDEKFGDHHSPRGYLVYSVNDNWTIKGGIATGFRAPTIKESTAGAATQSRGNGCTSLKGTTWYDENGKPQTYSTGQCYMAGNANLKPEKSVNYEIAINYAGEHSNANLTYFYTDFENKIEYAPLGIRNNIWWTQLQNIQKARTQGIELSALIPLHDTLNWNNSATYFIESKNLDTGRALINTPKMTLTSSLDYNISDAWAVNLVAEYVGKQYTTNQTKASTLQKAHTIMGLSSNYQVNENLTVRAGIQNLLNKKMSRSTSDYYLEGQSAFVGMTFKF